METPSTNRNFTHFASTIVIASLVIGVAIFVSSYFGTSNIVSRTVTVPAMTTTVSSTVNRRYSALLQTSTATSIVISQPPVFFVTHGAWNYTMSLSPTEIQQDQNLTTPFTLTNISNQTQRVDLDDPRVPPTIYSQNGMMVWTWQPPSYDEVENVTAGQVISQQMVLPTWELKDGQSYTVNTSLDIGTPDFQVFMGQFLQMNQMITVVV